MVSPVPVASSDPVVTCWLEVSIKALISLAAVALRCASVRTSAATTAKPRPCSPAGGLHRSVQRQDIGLEGNALDDRDDFMDLGGTGRDVLHGGDHAPHGLAAGLGCLRGGQRHRAALLRAFGVLFHGGR